jgi:hypothetical protein
MLSSFSVCDSSNIVAQPRGYGNVALPHKSSSITSHLARQRQRPRFDLHTIYRIHTTSCHHRRPTFKIHQFKP